MVSPTQLELQGTCLKCKRHDMAVILARKDLYCHDCFLLFVKSKYRRAMDAFRLELPPNKKDVKMLLALSGGESSSVLVDLVCCAVRCTRGRHAMPVVLHIDDSDFTDVPRTLTAARIEALRQRYPEMTFLERSMDDIDAYARTTSREPDHGSVTDVDGGRGVRSTLKECIAALKSRTSQEDMVNLYRDRLILESAKELDCEAILYGESATALAAKTLALTAKGRGYAVPWETADHARLHAGGPWHVRPLKGLLSTEVEAYSTLVRNSTNLSGPLVLSAKDAEAEKVMPKLEDQKQSSKATSIDDLTRRYFHSLETQFPSLVATVVRTTSKLVAPGPSSMVQGNCSICGMSLQRDARDWLRDITVNEPAPDASMGGSGSAEGPIDPATEAENASKKVAEGAKKVGEEDLCFGCVVATRGVDNCIKWPTFPRPSQQVGNSSLELASRGNDRASVVGEFNIGEND